MPTGLIDLLRRDLDQAAATECTRTQACGALPVDLNRDGAPEWVIIPAGPGFPPLPAYGQDSTGNWRRVGTLTPAGRGPPRPALLDTLARAPVPARVVDPEYRDLQIGPWRFRLR